MKHIVSEPAQLPSSGKEAPKLVDPLDQATWMQIARFIRPTRLGIYLKMEAEPASETSCFIKKLDDWQSPEKEDCVIQMG
jgi:hypothetical protein